MATHNYKHDITKLQKGPSSHTKIFQQPCSNSSLSYSAHISVSKLKDNSKMQMSGSLMSLTRVACNRIL